MSVCQHSPLCAREPPLSRLAEVGALRSGTAAAVPISLSAPTRAQVVGFQNARPVDFSLPSALLPHGDTDRHWPPSKPTLTQAGQIQIPPSKLGTAPSTFGSTRSGIDNLGLLALCIHMLARSSGTVKP